MKAEEERYKQIHEEWREGKHVLEWENIREGHYYKIDQVSTDCTYYHFHIFKAEGSVKFYFNLYETDCMKAKCMDWSFGSKIKAEQFAQETYIKYLAGLEVVL